jgi:O-antigen/teichoic acid export membrane protein
MNNAWPFGLAAFFYLIYYQSNIILLKYLIGDEAAGIYNVAFTVMAAVYLLPGVIYQKYLLPKIHRWANHDTQKFYEVYRYGIKAMFTLGIVAMIGIWLTAFWAIPLLFGKKYVDAVSLLNILALSAPIIFLAFNSGATLVTKENMLRKVKYMGYVAILNILLNITLIPLYNTSGAAIATVLSNSVLLYLYSFGTKKYVFSHQHNKVAVC